MVGKLNIAVTGLKVATYCRKRVGVGMRRERKLLLGISYPIEAVARTFGIKQPISPLR